MRGFDLIRVKICRIGIRDNMKMEIGTCKFGVACTRRFNFEIFVSNGIINV